MNETDITIAVEDAKQADVAALMAEADAYLRTLYPAQGSFPVDVTALSAPGVVFLAGRRDGSLLGSVALRPIAAAHAEVKRLFVHEAARGCGLGRRLLGTLESEARARGVDRISLEVGIRQPQAIQLYRSVGYRDCGPFGTYRLDPLSLFMTKRFTP
ncbi:MULTISPECIES: GNAT family N-acetyltransferase [Bradyrhizobium]|uniref:IAA acetyltransferase n=1 Tax=Bradyrhizobium oligotrophicum S58 TaxID=1245469 RepID=M5A2A4_9BRAD|nr:MULTISPECIES: GNAT family N-acetyltransferase [Bradyrhizobium]BAM93010.1 IAA acetyltransferase [Bradyrhizobium oligotrophicum S58]